MSLHVQAKMFEHRKQSFSTTSACSTISKGNANNDSNLPQNNNTELLSSEDLKALHAVYIRERPSLSLLEREGCIPLQSRGTLYKDREAPVIPFYRDLILATCFHCLDKEKRSELLKE
jgi:hypothetical protein